MAWSWEVDDIPHEEWKEAFRANGEVLCETCGKPYRKHYQPAKQSCPTLVIGCDGRWLKL
jgi:hypothetical protein